MIVDERIVRTLENALIAIKEPKSDRDLYMALRLMAAVSKQESVVVKYKCGEQTR